jgi:uncharacterized protein
MENQTGVAATSHAAMTAPLRAWTTWQVLGQSLLIFIVFSLLSTVIGVLVALLAGARSANDVGGEIARMLNEDGLTMGLSVIASTFLIVPYVRRLTARRELHAWSFLLGKSVQVAVLLRWCAAVLVLIAASDLLTYALGRPVVPPWMQTLYASGYTPILFVAIVIGAPVVEELLMRSFLLGGLIAAGTRVWIAVAVSAVAWAALHIQYDWYGMALILPLGLLLAAARLRTGSIYPCIAVHAIANTIAFIEAAVL